MTNAPIGTQPQKDVRPRITDPNSCGEDLQRNLSQVFALAPSICNGCADYHIVTALKRIAGQSGWSGGTRQLLLDTLRTVFSDLKMRNDDRVDILIAACADTGVLATCAHALSTEDTAFSERVSVTVVDRCPTPLKLCEAFAERHGLAVQTEKVDLIDTTTQFAADIVILHNLLVFVPESEQRNLLRTLAGWLKPDGCIVIWHPLVQPKSRMDYRSKREKRLKTIIEMIESRSVEIDEPLDSVRQRIERNLDEFLPGRPRTAKSEALLELIDEAGLVILTKNEVEFQIGGSSTSPRVQGLMAVVARPQASA